ncbi:hypothetical protein M9Y10_002489 [Tritrichomonas musculus]|uniref:MARVEL domain-containing protein n=1 Tax=Tritrichomonas musculus TaxID=1915356 RepID=A0ABR2LAY1_9EUKA
MDLNFGITNQYLRPLFLLRVVTGILTFATLIYMFVLDTNLYEYIWRKPVSNGNLAAATTAFFILAIIVTILIQFSIVEKIPFIGENRLYQVLVAGGFAAFTLLFALIFGCKNISTSYKNKICNEKTGTFWDYWENHHADDERFKEWERKHHGAKNFRDYFANRTTRAGNNVLGLFITLAILDAALLFYFYQDDNTAGFTNINDPISSANNTPSYN